MSTEQTRDSLNRWKAANEALLTGNDDYVALPDEEQADPARAERLINLRRDEASAWNDHMKSVLGGLGS